MAAANRPESKGLRRSSLPFSPFADTFPLVFPARDRRQGCDRRLRDVRNIFGLLAAVPVWRQAPIDLASRDHDMLKRFLLPHEHGQGPAAHDHYYGARHSPAVSAKICVAAAADVCVCVDVQPVSAPAFCGDHLDIDNRVERAAF